MNQRCILMVGTALSAHGGISAVVQAYADAGLFEAWNVRYVATYESRSWPVQMRVMGRALCAILGLLLRGRVALGHIHSAARGSFWRKSLVAALLGCFRVPYVFHLHSGEFPVFYAQHCGPLARAWVRLTLRRAARVVVLSGHWRAAIAAIEPRARLFTLGNPVQVPAALAPLRSPARVLLYLGRLQTKKGVFDLLRALPAVLRQAPDTELVLAGDGLRAALEELAQCLGVRHALRFPGWVDGEAKRKLLAAADVFVLPSYFEALPVGMLEAMAHGIAVVGTPVGGVPDLVEDGVHGLLVAPGQTEQLGAAILAALSDDGLRARLRAGAYARVAHGYAPAAVFGQLRSLYGQLGVARDPLPAHGPEPPGAAAPGAAAPGAVAPGASARTDPLHL